MVWCARLAVAMLLAANPGFGASSLVTLRAASEQSFQQLTKLREEGTVTRGELDAVAAQIAQSKGQAKGKLLPGRQLQDLLRRSQELSNKLTNLATAIATQETELQHRNGLLLEALSQEIARLRHDWETSKGRDDRNDLVRAMRSLRSEQQRIRGTQPATTLPTFAGSKASSDDPEDLLEQADTLRDSEDKVRRQLQALNAQIADAREQRDLERRMGEFLADQSIFDEHDRRFRTQAGGSSAPTVGSPVSGVARSPGTVDSPASPSGQAPEAGRSSALTESVRRDQPPFSQIQPGGRSQDNLQALEAERRRLESLARQLELQAQALEQRARALE